MSEHNTGNGHQPDPGQPQQQPNYPAQPAGYPAQPPAPHGTHPQGGYPPQQGYPAQGQAPAAKPAGPNPFAGIPVTDFVMDGVAALLLLISLGLPWNFENRATGRLEVILILVLSLLSLSVHYLARFGVFPATWKPSMVALLRAALNAPFVLLVLTYVVIDILAGFNIGDSYGGLGGAAALGLAGALLAAAPRKAELDHEPDPRQTNLSLQVFTGLAGLTVVLQPIALIAVFVSGALDRSGVTATIAVIVMALAAAAIAGWALVGVIRRDASWRPVVAALGITAVFAFIFLWSNEYPWYGNDALSTGLGTASGQVGLAYVFLPALGALALTPAIKQAMQPQPEHQAWIASAKNAADYVLLVAGSTALILILRLIAGDAGAVVVVLLIMTLIIAVGGLLTRTSISNDVVAGRNQALIVAGALTLFALVSLIIIGASDDLAATLETFLLAFGLPALVFIGLTAPKPVREFFSSHAPAPAAVQHGAPTGQHGQPYQQDHAYQQGQPAQPAQPGQGYPQAPQPAQQAPQPAPQAPTQQAPAQPAPAEPAPTRPAPEPTGPAQSDPAGSSTDSSAQEPAATHGFTAAQAADPSTDLGVLAQIVQDAPELRAAVAGNPSTYPDLLNWLKGLNDPEISAAIAARGDQ